MLEQFPGNGWFSSEAVDNPWLFGLGFLFYLDEFIEGSHTMNYHRERLSFRQGDFLQENGSLKFDGRAFQLV